MRVKKGCCPICGGDFLRDTGAIIPGPWQLHGWGGLAYTTYECYGCRKEFRVVPERFHFKEPEGIKIETL